MYISLSQRLLNARSGTSNTPATPKDGKTPRPSAEMVRQSSANLLTALQGSDLASAKTALSVLGSASAKGLTGKLATLQKLLDKGDVNTARKLMHITPMPVGDDFGGGFGGFSAYA